MQLRRLLFACSLVVTVSAAADTIADDWPMYGRDRTHNAVSPERNPPTDWEVGKFDTKTGNWVGSRKRFKRGHSILISSRLLMIW